MRGRAPSAPVAAESADDARAPHQFNFVFSAEDGEYFPPNDIFCLFEDVLRYREPDEPGGEPVLTFAIAEENVEEGAPYRKCAKDFSNLTRLDEQKVRDEVGAILGTMQCQPGSNVDITFSSYEKPNLGRDYPGVRHKRAVSNISIIGCLPEIQGRRVGIFRTREAFAGKAGFRGKDVGGRGGGDARAEAQGRVGRGLSSGRKSKFVSLFCPTSGLSPPKPTSPFGLRRSRDGVPFGYPPHRKPDEMPLGVSVMALG